jgi:predicted GNAT superfamily acetyltransferase
MLLLTTTATPPRPVRRRGGSGMRVREATAADYAAIRTLNNSAVPHVNALSEEEFAWLSSHANFLRLAEDATGLLGFALVLPSGGEYWSENYRWFTARFDRFVYLDRVVVAPQARRRGVGRALYEALFHYASDTWPRLTLEVNLRPPNPDSVQFHEALGFTTLGVREYDDGRHAVLMMAKELQASRRES